MKEEKKSSEPKPVAEKKELTPQQLQKRKKMLILPLFFLIFAAAMWLIFAPSGPKEGEEQTVGFNADIPMPKEEGIIGDKRDAYEKEAMKDKEQEKMRSLQDFAFTLGEADTEQEKTQAEYDRQFNLSPADPEYYDTPIRSTPHVGSSRGSAIQSSANAYRDINRQLGSWYEQPAKEEDEQAKRDMQLRIEELEGKLGEESRRKQVEDEQLAMVEKSFQLAAKYMPASTGQEAQQAKPAPPTAASSGTDKVVAQPVRQVRQSVVSLLAAPVSDEEFIATYSKPRNMGFHTAAGSEGVQDKNSIRACVYQTVTLTNGREVQLRLLEPMWAGDRKIPANTLLTGACRITGERMEVAINSVQYAENIIPVELQVYDTDGLPGIFIPGSDEITAVKEIASSLGSSAGSSIMISDNAGSQLAADMGKGLIQGASQYVSKKLQTVKVTLKANHRLLLLPKKQ